MTREVLDAVLASLVQRRVVELEFSEDRDVELGLLAERGEADLLDDGTLHSTHHGSFNGLPWVVRLVRSEVAS